jgi:hypothetical protein
VINLALSLGMRLTLSCFVILLSLHAAAQSKRQPAQDTPAEAYFPQEEQAPKNVKKKAGGTTFDAREKSYERLERNWKSREKKEKKLSRNPDKDYSVGPYFGHKRPPKIRPIGKRKVCKICGVTH